MRFWLPIRSGGLPICRRRFPYPVAFPICFRGSPCDSTAFHTQAIFPYGIAVFPYGHTPDASPHTPHQIPIGRPSPHTIRKLQKSDFKFGETSGSSPTNLQPTTSSKHPEPALHSGKSNANRFKQITWLQSTQTKRRPSPANATDLRLGGAVTSCTYGHAHTFMGTRTAMVILARSLTCTAMVIPSRACARPRQRPGAFLTRPASGSHRSSANPVHSSALRLRNTSADLQSNRPTQNAWGAWATTTLRRRRRQWGPAPVLVRPEGRTCSRA